jgi:hypothetical protein
MALILKSSIVINFRAWYKQKSQKKQLQKNKKKYWKKIKQKYQWEEYTITLGKLSKIGWGRYNNPAFS